MRKAKNRCGAIVAGFQCDKRREKIVTKRTVWKLVRGAHIERIEQCNWPSRRLESIFFCWNKRKSLQRTQYQSKQSQRFCIAAHVWQSICIFFIISFCAMPSILHLHRAYLGHSRSHRYRKMREYWIHLLVAYDDFASVFFEHLAFACRVYLTIPSDEQNDFFSCNKIYIFHRFIGCRQISDASMPSMASNTFAALRQ